MTRPPQLPTVISTAIEKMAAALAQEVFHDPAFREELKRLARQTVRRAMGDPLNALPPILTLKELALLYRLSSATIRTKVQQGTFAPRPFDKYPYRWRRDDVVADLKRARPEQPKRPHGFATTRRPKPDFSDIPELTPEELRSGRRTIDYSDIPASTPEQLRTMKRIGRGRSSRRS